MTTDLNSIDTIHRFEFVDHAIRGQIVTLNNSFIEASQHQNLPIQAKQLLGQFLAAAGMLAENFKFNGLLTLQARGDGDLPLMMAEATNTRNIRGLVKLSESHLPHDMDGKCFRELLGKGVLTLTVDPEKGQRYQGIVPLEQDSIAQCLSDYFAHSEQVPSRLWLFADHQRAAGLLLQAMPGESPDSDAWQTAEQLANTVKAEELLQLDHNTLLYRLFNEYQVRLYEPKNVQFKCSCNRERCLNAINALGKEDAYKLISERNHIDMDCQFCGTQYRFKKEDLDQQFGDDGQTLH